MTTSAQIVAAAAVLRSVWATDWEAKLGPLTTSGELIALAIARGETDFGNAPGFAGSNNWGALVCYRQDYGCLAHGDHDANGNPITASFQKYPSQVEGCRGFLQTLLGKHKAVVPLQSGSALDVATAMFQNGYYTGITGGSSDRELAYATMIASQAAVIAAALGIDAGAAVLATSTAKAPSAFWPICVAVGVGWALYKMVVSA